MHDTFKPMFEAILKDFSSFVVFVVERGTTATVDGLTIFYLSIMALILAFLTAAIANHKGGSFFKWFVAGALIGIIALPIAMFKRKKVVHSALKQCPECAEQLPVQTLVCDGCDYNFVSMMAGYRHKPVPPPAEYPAQ
jgi:hypothetical protein